MVGHGPRPHARRNVDLAYGGVLSATRRVRDMSLLMSILSILQVHSSLGQRAPAELGASHPDAGRVHPAGGWPAPRSGAQFMHEVLDRGDAPSSAPSIDDIP